jgi:hypothetical protein
MRRGQFVTVAVSGDFGKPEITVVLVAKLGAVIGEADGALASLHLFQAALACPAAGARTPILR